MRGVMRGIVDDAVVASTPFVGPLDSFAPITAGYSVFRLLSAYGAGKSVNVRRTSDSGTLDAGFLAAGDPDGTALASFLAATTGFGTKWYDQSGGANDISQGTAANQPAITLNALGSLPGIFCSGTAGTKLTGSFAWAAGAAPWTVCMVVMAWSSGGTATAVQSIFSYGTATNTNQDVSILTKATTNKYGVGLFTSGNALGAATFAPAVICAYYDGTTLNLNVNGVLTSGAGAANLTSTALVVGDDLSAGNAGLTTLGELVMWPSNIGATNVAAYQANARTRFGF